MCVLFSLHKQHLHTDLKTKFHKLPPVWLQNNNLSNFPNPHYFSFLLIFILVFLLQDHCNLLSYSVLWTKRKYKCHPDALRTENHKAGCWAELNLTESQMLKARRYLAMLYYPIFLLFLFESGFFFVFIGHIFFYLHAFNNNNSKQ